MSILAVAEVGIEFGGVRALDDVSFEVASGEIFSLVGPNGAGKTTLFNVISGIYAPSHGRILLDGRDVTGLEPQLLAKRGLSRTFQNLQVFYRMTAVENVMVGRHLKESRNVFAHLLALPSARRENMASRDAALDFLEFSGLTAYADVPAGNMPYGALKRLEISRTLAADPKILLLDEPAAGCNPTETAEIEALITTVAAGGTTVVLVEHDMKLVMRVSDRIHVISEGRTLTEGTAADVARDPKVVAAYLGVSPDIADDGSSGKLHA